MKLRAAEGSEIDWLNAEWHIPAIRMKMPVNLIVPPSRQTVAILRQIQPLTGQGRYVFRASACTMPNEMGKHPDCGSSGSWRMGERDGMRAAYNYVEHLPQRRVMMQQWADYLDRLKQSKNMLA